jgi:WD40 repeat protein
MNRQLTHVIFAALVFSSGMCIADDKITFDDHAMPIFRQRCATCHNANKKSGGLDISNYTALMQGGSSGSVIEPGDADSSYLYNLVTHEDSPEMPPNSDKIPQAEIDALAAWINGGALENMKSKSTVAKKSNLALSADANPTARPEIIPLPPRMSLEPLTTTDRPSTIRSMATSPWAPLVAVASQKQIVLYDTSTLQITGVLAFPEGEPNVLRFSRNGKLLLAGGGKDASLGKVIVWDVETAERIIEVGNEIDTVLAADISPDQSMVALGGPQKIVRIYSTETGQQLFEINKHTDWVTALEFSPDGVLLATGDRSGGLFVWEAMTAREYLTLKGHTEMISSVSWRTDSNVVASASEDTTVRLWEMENGGQIKSWGAHGGGVASVEYTRDGRIVSAGRDRTAKLWDGNGGEIRTFEAFNDVATTATFCNETNRVVGTDWTGEIRIWNAEDGNRLGNIASNPPALSQRIATAEQSQKQATEKLQPINDAAAKSNESLTALKQTIATSQSAVNESTTAIQTAQTEMETIKKAEPGYQQQKTDLTGSLAQHREATSLLEESLQKATAAAEKLASNAQLQQAAKQLGDQLEQLKQTAAQVEASLQQVDAEIQKGTARLAELDALLAQQTAKKAAAEKALADATAQLPNAEKDAAEKTAVAQQAQAELDAANAQLQRWQNELAFHQQLVALKEQLQAASQVSDQRQTELDEAKAKLEQMQQQMQQAESTATAAQQQVDQIKQQIINATSREGQTATSNDN